MTKKEKTKLRHDLVILLTDDGDVANDKEYLSRLLYALHVISDILKGFE